MNEKILKVDKLLEEATLIASQKVTSGEVLYSSSSNKNEEFMVRTLQEAAKNIGFDVSKIKHVKGHAFPDVIIEGFNIGIELKGAKTGDSFNGNSVMGSTFDDSLKKIYLYFWVEDTKKIGFCDYFESVVSSVVTHSPRFRLKLGIHPSECMFGLEDGKVGSIEEVIFSKNGIDSDKIIDWMRMKAYETGQESWWMGERSFVDDLPNNQGLRINKGSLTILEQKEILEKGFFIFPELLSSRQDKFNSFISWAISLHGVVLNRDFFTAGGIVTIPNNNGILPYVFSNVQVPQILYKYLNVLWSVQDLILSKDDLTISFGKKIHTIDDYLSAYINTIDREFSQEFASNKPCDDQFYEMRSQIIKIIQEQITIL